MLVAGALIVALAAPAEAGVNGRSFSATVSYSLGGPIATCIAFNPNDNGGTQNIEGLVPEPITYLQVDLFLLSFWSASYGTTTVWSNGFELFGILAIAAVNDELYGQGTFIGFPGACPFARGAVPRTAAGRAPGKARIERAEPVPRMQPCRAP
jgi:hypothetical protein